MRTIGRLNFGILRYIHSGGNQYMSKVLSKGDTINREVVYLVDVVVGGESELNVPRPVVALQDVRSPKLIRNNVALGVGGSLPNPEVGVRTWISKSSGQNNNYGSLKLTFVLS